jgi:hypothetical protein
MNILRRREEALESAGGEDGGCDRCCGLLATVSNTITGELHCARWNGETTSEEEVPNLRSGIRCPRCARKLYPGDPHRKSSLACNELDGFQDGQGGSI